MDSPISQYCQTISSQRQTISDEQLKSLFDVIVIELNKNKNNNTINDDYYKIIDTLKNVCGLTLVNPVVVGNELFHLIRHFLTNLLNKWSCVNGILSNKDEYLFQEIVELFFKMIQHIRSTNQNSLSVFQTWFLNEPFFKAIASVIEDISKNSEKYIHQDENMKSLIILIQSIQCLQQGLDHIKNNSNVLLLIDPIIKCLCSSIYIDTMKNIDIKSNNPSTYEEFILGTLPCYCVWYRGNAQLTMITQLCVRDMLKSYQEIYELFLPTIDDWEYPIKESIFYMTAFLRYVAFYPSTREHLTNNLKILDSILILLTSSSLLDNVLITTEYNSETNITDSAISFIFNLTQDFQFLTSIKENPHFSKEIFVKLKYAKVDRVKLHAFMILAKILNEHDILKLDHIDTLTSVFISYLCKAVNDSSHSFQDVPVEHLLLSLKAFAQHDEIKEEIARQNYFGFIIRCATQTDLHVGLVLQTALEVIWSLTFNNKIHQILINSYSSFVRYLKTVLINSTEQGVQAAAQGILWKLEDESVLKKQILDHHENKPSEEKYDIMISYSHANKDLCLEVYQSLLKSNYRVWLDFENMYGSTLQSMATAIELSEIILICMSNPYKQSAYCRSEAEYAYTRQRQIIPLVMEKKYRPDGWLGIICASKLYVDFTKTDFEPAFQKLIAQIQLHEQRASVKVATPSIIKTEKQEPLVHEVMFPIVTKVQECKQEERPQVEELMRLTSTENHYNDRYIEWWTHEDVLHFLRDKQLDILRTLFEHEPQVDGYSLYILYQQAESNIESTYQLLNSQLTRDHERPLSYLTYLHFLKELRTQFHPVDIKQYIRSLLWTFWTGIHRKFY